MTVAHTQGKRMDSVISNSDKNILHCRQCSTRGVYAIFFYNAKKQAQQTDNFNQLVWKSACFLKSLLKTATQDLRLREEVGEAFEQRQSRRKGLLFGGRGGQH